MFFLLLNGSTTNLTVPLHQGASHLTEPVYIIASRASKSAIEAIEKTGGKLVCKYYNNLALQDCVEGRIDRLSAAPTRREDIGAEQQAFFFFWHKLT